MRHTLLLGDHSFVQGRERLEREVKATAAIALPAPSFLL
jgi:hypothetical protein